MPYLLFLKKTQNLKLSSAANCRLKSTFSKESFQEIPSECKIVWVKVSLDILLGLRWVQTVRKGYQQRDF